MSASPEEAARRWLARDPDPDTRREIEALLADPSSDALADCFGERLRFGTAGLRGILGAGPAAMNRLVVRETTAGLADYLAETVENARERGVVIGYDGRLKSDVFAQDAAAVLAARGFQVHVFDRLACTPLTAFAVLELGCAAGVMVTASHNPPEYNGYKVYWGNGAQIIPPHDGGIAAAIACVAAGEPVKLVDNVDAHPSVRKHGQALVDAYHTRVAELDIHPDAPRDLVIAYTPLHGVGAAYAERALADLGFADVYTVEAQREPDGRFPTVRFPNPEEPGAMDRLFELAERRRAQLALANDPDADRLAVGVRDGDGNWFALSGNQIGVLLGADRLAGRGSAATVAASIVSSRMLGRVAKAQGARYFETLTGFKWIANEAMRHEDPARPFVFGYEEAIGFTVGTLVRDKDGVSAVAAFATLAAALHAEGRTVLDELERLYRAHGLFATSQRSLKLDGEDPRPPLTDRIRADWPTHIAGIEVTARADLRTGERITADGARSTVDLPSSDVLVFELDDDSRVIVRPSGTEPKVKCYYEVCVALGVDELFADGQARADKALRRLVEAHQAELSQR